MPAILQNALIEDLGKSVVSAANGDGAHPSPGSWVITGEFLEVDTGNCALQTVGLGAGQSHLEVRAKIYAVPNMDTPFLTFDSEGASGHMPGAAVMHKNPYVAAAKFVMSRKNHRGRRQKLPGQLRTRSANLWPRSQSRLLNRRRRAASHLQIGDS